jgi:hypothetical protein
MMTEECANVGYNVAYENIWKNKPQANGMKMVGPSKVQPSKDQIRLNEKKTITESYIENYDKIIKETIKRNNKEIYLDLTSFMQKFN